jgi:hypothetical protein
LTLSLNLSGTKTKKTQKKKKDKKKDAKKKADKTEGAEEDKEESDEDDKNKVIYKPSIEECHQHVLHSMDSVISSTNSVNSLESDLMPFLQKQASPNF